jgi:hypothetical protein
MGTKSENETSSHNNSERPLRFMTANPPALKNNLGKIKMTFCCRKLSYTGAGGEP